MKNQAAWRPTAIWDRQSWVHPSHLLSCACAWMDRHHASDPCLRVQIGVAIVVPKPPVFGCAGPVAATATWTPACCNHHCSIQWTSQNCCERFVSEWVI